MRWRSACQPKKSRLSCLFRVDVDCIEPIRKYLSAHFPLVSALHAIYCIFSASAAVCTLVAASPNSNVHCQAVAPF